MTVYNRTASDVQLPQLRATECAACGLKSCSYATEHCQLEALEITERARLRLALMMASDHTRIVFLLIASNVDESHQTDAPISICCLLRNCEFAMCFFLFVCFLLHKIQSHEPMQLLCAASFCSGKSW